MSDRYEVTLDRYFASHGINTCFDQGEIKPVYQSIVSILEDALALDVTLRLVSCTGPVAP